MHIDTQKLSRKLDSCGGDKDNSTLWMIDNWCASESSFLLLLTGRTLGHTGPWEMSGDPLVKAQAHALPRQSLVWL